MQGCSICWKFTSNTIHEEALKALRRTSFDVVISNLRMPNMPGFELLPNMRCHHPQVGMPPTNPSQKGAYTPEQLVAAIESAMQLHWLL